MRNDEENGINLTVMKVKGPRSWIYEGCFMVHPLNLFVDHVKKFLFSSPKGGVWSIHLSILLAFISADCGT